MATLKKTTKIAPEQEYKKELKRIQQFMRRAEKRGYFWDKSPIPKQPKKITPKSVDRLRKITPDVLYKKGEYVDQSTGEIISGTRGRKLERKLATEKATETRKAKQNKNKKNNKSKRKKADPKPAKTTNKIKKPNDIVKFTESKKEDDYYPSFTDIVLSNFHSTLTMFPNAEGTPLLLAWFDAIIADNGREAVAQMLQDGAEQGLLITWETVYKSNNTKTYMAEMMQYLPDQGNNYVDQIMDMMEQLEWWEQPE